MTPGIVGRAVLGLMVTALTCVVGVVLLAITDHQTEASLTGLVGLAGTSSGALAGLLANVSAPGAILGGRRATDPKPVPAEVISDVVHAQDDKAS